MASHENGKLMMEDGVQYSDSKKKRKQENLDQRINDYVDGFTVHGLTKVFRSNKRESCVWIIFILTGVLFASVVIGRLLSKYYKFATYTDVQRIITDHNTLPSLTVCDFKAMQIEYFSYCGQQFTNWNNGDTICDYTKMMNLPNPDDLPYQNTSVWRNALFEVIHCKTWSTETPCTKTPNITSRMNGACFTWNYNGDFHDDYGHLELKFKLRNNDSIEQRDIVVLPHDSDNVEIDLMKRIAIESAVKYQITIGKTLLLRKPEPYSGCQDRAGSDDLDIFPGAYSRHTCIETYKQMNIFKKCGGVFDHIRKYLPESSISRYEDKNKTLNEIKSCIGKEIEAKGPPKELCPFPCKELELRLSPHSYKSSESKKNVYDVELQLESVDSYTLMEEQPIYSLEQMSAEIGGFLGLVMGASLLSFIELFVCGMLFTFRKVHG
ncbi:acid-sensing ion channel 5-like [Clytia hemisphaerica]|uniref:Uncharacterized protein n=1 Tax=Clytia hemisphaerica TaxID=252671 RepID=A0A7M5V621_9CNID|eukprot:TCONS_00063458-protein